MNVKYITLTWASLILVPVRFLGPFLALFTKEVALFLFTCDCPHWHNFRTHSLLDPRQAIVYYLLHLLQLSRDRRLFNFLSVGLPPQNSSTPSPTLPELVEEQKSIRRKGFGRRPYHGRQVAFKSFLCRNRAFRRCLCCFLRQEISSRWF